MAKGREIKSFKAFDVLSMQYCPPIPNRHPTIIPIGPASKDPNTEPTIAPGSFPKKLADIHKVPITTQSMFIKRRGLLFSILK